MMQKSKGIQDHPKTELRNMIKYRFNICKESTVRTDICKNKKLTLWFQLIHTIMES